MYIVASGRIRESLVSKSQALEYAQELSKSNVNDYTDECTAYVHKVTRNSQITIAEYADGKCIYLAA